MPSEKVLLEKQQAVADLKAKLEKAVSGVLVDYKGINVASDTKLRKELREAGVDYSVYKNYTIRDGKYSLPGLPAVYADNDEISCVSAYYYRPLCKYMEQLGSA